jgi:hypothetical protein
MASQQPNHLLQCHIYRSSRQKGELPAPGDPSVIRLVRLAKPFLDTPETVLKCLGEGVSLMMNGNINNNNKDTFLQPIVEYLDQANLHYITFMNSASPQASLKAKFRGANDALSSYSSGVNLGNKTGDAVITNGNNNNNKNQSNSKSRNFWQLKEKRTW